MERNVIKTIMFVVVMFSPFEEPEIRFIYFLQDRKGQSPSFLCGGDHIVRFAGLEE